MRPGDVLTHSFHGHRCGILDSEMKVLPDIRKSQMYLQEMSRLLPRTVGKKKLSHFAAVYHSEAFALEDVDIQMGFLLNDGVMNGCSCRVAPNSRCRFCLVWRAQPASYASAV